jgi:L-threonylcarbamoyladenylate synthase
MPPAKALTRILAVDPSAPDGRVIAEAARVLRGGGLVAFPTETVYGLGARALDEAALARVFAAKGRPAHHPLIAHVLGEDDARALAAEWPAAASRIARGLWPGPVTLVVPRAATVPAAIATGESSIAVRAPSHAVARALIATLGEPIAAPSANRYQRLSPTTASHVVEQLGAAVDLVLDGGACSEGIESTVVDLRTSPARVLRPGAASLAQLRALVPDVEARRELAVRGASRASPGMDSRHYAPRARLQIVAKSEVRALIAALVEAGLRVGAVTRALPADSLACPGRAFVKQLPEDPEGYARLLYVTLHDLDGRGVDAIVVEAVPTEEEWWAVSDRLLRATFVE